MSEQDEYDAHFVPFTLNRDDLDAIQAAEAKELSYDHTTEHTSNSDSHRALRSPTPPSPDEFDAYDLSEFSAEDFEQIDKLVHSICASPSPQIHEVHDRPTFSGTRSPLERGSPTRGDGGVKNGGPSIEIALEPNRNADPPRRLKDSWIKHTKRSPYEQFRHWNRLLSVTDIAGPSWCEVQFDYGLRQKRHKKLADRPTSFVTAEGKTITVARQVAAANNRTVTRGRSVHKVLEREIQPEAVQVKIMTNEERWALRLVNMLTSLHTMMGLGRCREMPVFGLIHDQIVTGVIDEIVRQPLPMSPISEHPRPRRASTSPNKRPAPHTTPSSPAAPSSKRICPELSADQRQNTPLSSPTNYQGGTAEMAMDVDFEEPATPVPSQRELPEADDSLAPHAVHYSLHLSDTKTRIRPTLPPEEDTFAARIQLMLYHRLLSNLLSAAQSDIASSQPLDFDAFWQKAKVNPTLRFSDSFLLQTGLPDAGRTTPESTSTESAIDLSGIHCLDDLTRAWHRAVEALNAAHVDNTLTIVYRAQPTKGGASATGSGKGKDKDKGMENTSEPTATSTPSSALSLSDQEARDIAAAVQASISDVQPGMGGDDDLARALFESLRDAIRSGQASEGELGILTHPFGPPISDAMRTLEGEGRSGAGASASGHPPALRHATVDGLAEDPQLAWALQQSLLARLDETPVLKEAISEAVMSSGADASAVDEVDDAPEKDGGESGVAVGKLLPRAATAEPEGVAKTAPSSPSPPHMEEDEDEMMITAAELETEAKILGTKEFDLDDALLDDYLEGVLAWWYGKRPPQGVDVELTRRCVTCEYRDGCEWRENKAQEALQKYQDQSLSGAAAGWL
ncbi:exonuclease V [Ganoderma leucocontextum]|nr:exonuclease V [Ganoderma leucocontextum]